MQCHLAPVGMAVVRETREDAGNRAPPTPTAWGLRAGAAAPENGVGGRGGGAPQTKRKRSCRPGRPPLSWVFIRRTQTGTSQRYLRPESTSAWLTPARHGNDLSVRPGMKGERNGWKPTRGTSQPSGEGEAAIRRPRMKPEVTVTRATSGRGERASTRDGVSAWEAENDLETAGDPAHRGSRLCARRAAGPLGGDRAVPHQ